MLSAHAAGVQVALPHVGVAVVAAVGCALTMVVNGHVVHLTSRLWQSTRDVSGAVVCPWRSR